MKKWYKLLLYFVFGLLALSIVAIIIIWTVLDRSKPSYEGEIALSGLREEVEINFDDFGVPHLYAQNPEDAYFSLGYLHANERLFQLELLRRAGEGSLSELLGPDLLEADKLFCTMGLRDYGVDSYNVYKEQIPKDIKKEVQAYVNGINAFVNEDRLPPEFKILGVEFRPFSEKDVLSVANYMAFSFSLGQRTDPLAEKIFQKLGSEYIANTALLHYDEEPVIPNGNGIKEHNLSEISVKMAEIAKSIPIPAFNGSNSWAVSSARSKTGKPILCNDTHMKHGMPSVWYESFISYPGFELYGNHIPGIPYALIGHTDRHAWGMTMLEQDDMDFYREELSPDKDQVKYKGEWTDTEKKSYTIKVKGGDEQKIQVISTPHGPVVNEVLAPFKADNPVSMWWEYTRHENHLLKAIRIMHKSKTMNEFSLGLELIHGPGLNVQYADQDDNIAWFGCAKLLKRPKHVNPKLFLDGASGKDEPIGYYPFSDNPMSINPPLGIIYSANDQPGALPDSTFYPGYYKPHHRGNRILRKLGERTDWDVESMKALINDVKSDVDADLFSFMKTQIDSSLLTEIELDILKDLNWDGNHLLEQFEPTVFYKWLYLSLEFAMLDELGEEDFESFLDTHWMKRAYPLMLKDKESPWWDDVDTEMKETMQEVMTYTYRKTIEELTAQFGKRYKKWTWNKARDIELAHPMGSVKPLNKLFNVGPADIPGGHETISQTGFVLNSEGFYSVRVGPQMRIVHSLADVNDSWSILPAGQSGHPLSDHYDDQFEMYLKGEFRKQHFRLKGNEASSSLIMNPN